MPAPVRVLYIDDDPGIRRLSERALTRRGYHVTCAESGPEGVACAAAEPFDVIAVDHYMPGQDGLETLAQLRALPAPPPVVYVTGTDESRIAVAALKAGAADYVVKSVGDDFFTLLAATFEQVLARAQLEHAKHAAEDELRTSNARLEALLGEVNHRVANSLQMVSAMVRLQSKALADPAARAALEDTQRRIAAIGQVHRRLYTSSDVESVDMQEYLAALVDELRATWSPGGGAYALSLAAEPIKLPTDRAVSVGVIVNELVSNSCKYAYPGGAGEVRVALQRDGTDRFVLSVEDDGVGLEPNAAPKGTGLGSQLIRTMAQSLNSIVEYDVAHGGTRALLRGALPA